MERLTKRVTDIVVYVGPDAKYPETGDIAAELTTGQIKKLLSKLADYEDTGLYPETIKRMDELIEEMTPVMGQFEKLMEQGRVIILPCKIGTTVYIFDKIVDIDLCEKCTDFCWGGMGDPHSCGKTEDGFRAPECITISDEVATLKIIFWWLHIDAFGKTVFFTREDAEKALEEMKNR